MTPHNIAIDKNAGLVRFIPKSNSGAILLGQPVDEAVDVGAAVKAGKDIAVTVFSGKSVLSPGEATKQTETVGTVLSPLAQEEVGTIRCIGLNVSFLGVIANVIKTANGSSTSNMQRR